MPHLFLAVTAHGYGHLAQSAPVAEELARRVAGLRITLQGDVDPSFVRNRLPSCSRHIPKAMDVGLPMDGPLRPPESGHPVPRRAGLGVLDVLGSCDAILTKPGYGTMAEAACNGKPVLYVSRRDWPEEPALTGWLKKQVPAREISLPDLVAGRVMDPIDALLEAGTVSPVPPTGIAEAADLLAPFLK